MAEKYGVGVIARVPIAFGALSGRFNSKTRFIGDDHRRNLYEGEGLQTTLRKVEKLKFLASKTMPLAEASLKWTLAYSAVSTSIPGIRNLRQALLNCAAGDGRGLAPGAARKAEKLYLKNFGLPVKRVSSREEVQAVFMSGFKLVPEKTAKRKTRKKLKSRGLRKKTVKKNSSFRKSAGKRFKK